MKSSAPGRARLPVREASGLALGNRISLHHPREAPHPALREREGLAFCPSTSPSHCTLCMQPPSRGDARMGQASRRRSRHRQNRQT